MVVRYIGAWFFLILAGLGGASAGPLDKPEDTKMTGDAIKAEWFNGQPFLSTAPDGSASFKFIFHPDGKASKVPAGRKVTAPAESGFWRTIAEGYCIRWTGSVREKCFNVRHEGDLTVVRFGKVIVANWAH